MLPLQAKANFASTAMWCTWRRTSSRTPSKFNSSNCMLSSSSGQSFKYKLFVLQVISAEEIY